MKYQILENNDGIAFELWRFHENKLGAFSAKEPIWDFKKHGHFDFYFYWGLTMKLTYPFGEESDAVVYTSEDYIV